MSSRKFAGALVIGTRVVSISLQQTDNDRGVCRRMSRSVRDPVFDCRYEDRQNTLQYSLRSVFTTALDGPPT